MCIWWFDKYVCDGCLHDHQTASLDVVDKSAFIYCGCTFLVSRQWDTFLGSAQEHNFTLSKRNVFIFPDDHQTGCLHVLTVVSSSSCEQLSSSHSCWMFLSTCDMFIVCIMSSQQGVKALPTLTVNERWKLSLSNPLRHQQNSFHTRAAELLSTTPASMSQTLPRSGTSQGFPWAAPNEHPIHSLVFFFCFS